MQGGSTGRYFLDFAWMFVLSGILIFMELYANYKTDEGRKLLSKIFIGIAIFTLIINLLLGFCEIGGRGIRTASPDMYLKVNYGICFLK